MKKESLDEKLQQAWNAYLEEKKSVSSTESGTEQFEEMVEKYQRNTFDDDER